MQKQVNFFERHVEWFALGLGGVFLLLMLFTYVMKAPVTETVGNTVVAPGDIDRETLAGPVEKLKREIADPRIPEIRQEEYVERFVATIQGSSQAHPQLAGNQIRSHPVKDVDGGGGTNIVSGGEGPPVTQLPVPPAAVFNAVSHGRSRVIWQDPNWVPRRATEQPKMIEADKDWCSGAWTIEGAALLKAFEKAFDAKKIDAVNLDPQLFMQTAIVDVQLERRQVLPGGKVGKTEVIKPLENSLKPPFPGKNAKDIEIKEYIKWVTQTPQEVIEPVFYEVLAGDLYITPSEENEALAAEMRTATLEQRKAMQAQKLAERQMRVQQNQAQRMRGRVPFNGAMDPDTMEEGMFIPPARGRGFYQPPVPPPVAPRSGVPRTRVGAAPAPQPMQVTPGNFPVMEEMPDIRIVAHDDTVEAGKTYQYRIRYQILNPVYQRTAAIPELTKEFAIPAKEYSAWSKPTTIRAKVEFFLASIKGDRAEFKVFEWREGRTRESTITVGAGDAISGTGWSLADARGSGRKAYGLVVDDVGGTVERRVPDVDMNSTRYQDLTIEVESASAQVGMNR